MRALHAAFDLCRYLQIKNYRAEQVISSPTGRGYLVIRIFINPATDFAALKSAQEQAKVAPLMASITGRQK